MKKTALITGGNRGIGFETARQLGKLGYRIILTARDESKGINAKGKLLSEGADCSFVKMDISDYASIESAYRTVSEICASIDVLINNAGIMSSGKKLTENDAEEIRRTIETNTLGPIFTAKVFSPLLKEGSRIINVSSGLGRICGGMQDYTPAYSISKTALNAATCQLAYAYKDKSISVNSVCPGWVKTDMGGAGATRSVEKGAETIVWLATEAPAELTGKFFRDKKEISF